MSPNLVMTLVALALLALWLLRRAVLRRPAQRPWIAWAQERIARASTPRIPLRVRSAVGNAVARLVRVADLTDQLSPAAAALVQKCYADIEVSELFDYHTHLFGTGRGCCEAGQSASGCFIPPEEDRDLKLQTVSTVLMKCAGVRSEETGDVSAIFFSREWCVWHRVTNLLVFLKCFNAGRFRGNAKENRARQAHAAGV